MTDYTELKRKIDEDYTLKRREEENFLLNHWKEFFSNDLLSTLKCGVSIS